MRRQALGSPRVAGDDKQEPRPRRNGRRLQNITAFCALAYVSSSVSAERPDFAFRNSPGYGININEALINPSMSGSTEDALRVQLARIMHTASMDNERVVRWFVNDVWPGYECSPDPENQSTGSLSPAWYVITRDLLQAAKSEGISVVVVMANTSGGNFLGLPLDANQRTSIIAGWSRESHGHRAEKNATQSSCEQQFQDGYYGGILPNEIFESQARIQKFSERFLKMAEFLSTWHSMVALEMFNEPSFVESQKIEFAKSISYIRNSLYAADPKLMKIPIYSGVAWWNPVIVSNLRETGDLSWEPYVNIHYYGTLGAGRASVVAEIRGNVEYVRRLIPGKQIVFSEIGSATSIASLSAHKDFLDSLIYAHSQGDCEMWFWGEWASDDAATLDFKWEFNSTALSGSSFRSMLISTEHEATYREKKLVTLKDETLNRDVIKAIAIRQLPSDHANKRWRLRMVLEIGDADYISVSRAGVLLKESSRALRYSRIPHASVIAIDSDSTTRSWAEITHEKSHWRLKVFRCESSSIYSFKLATPLYVLGYADALGREDFGDCSTSLLIFDGYL